MAAVGEIRQNPGGRRLLLIKISDERGNEQRGPLWTCLQLNGTWLGCRFGVPEQTLDEWHRIGTLPADDYAGPQHGTGRSA